MIHTEFKLWLQGYFALTDDTHLTPKQLVIIKNHATLVKAVEGCFEPWLEEIVHQLDSWISEDIPIALRNAKFWVTA